MNKPYLKSNYSEIEYGHLLNKDPFLTSNNRDFKPDLLKSLNSAVPNSEKLKGKELIRASKIVLGEIFQKNNSTYTELHSDPKDQRSKYNYDKIKYKYDPYNIHPITGEHISKASHNNWSFDYYNKDKVKSYVSNDKPMALNTNFRKIYDPITNRFLN